MSITDGTELLDTGYYAKNGPPHEIWTKLRAESPVHRCESEEYPPFWAITKHEDICAISRDPDNFLSYPGITMQRKGEVIDREEGVGAMRTIIEMDPPAHRSYRKVASPFFKPGQMKHIDPIVEESAKQLVDDLEGTTGKGECDFAMKVAVAHPLRVLSTVLGVPREQEPRILELTNQLFAPEDEEIGIQGGLSETDKKQREAAIIQLGMELYQLFEPIIEDRRKNPQNDLATLLANGVVDGEPMGPMETLGYFLITFTAGHDTTKNALAGGMHQLAANPKEFAKLQKNPELAASAVEEIVRWTSPVNYMKRTAARDAVVGKQKVSEGDELIMFYASANRDEDVFEAPFEFRVDRSPNAHIGFGHGEHFCLGAHLARRSQRALVEEIVRRIDRLELVGEPKWIKSSFVVGLKHLPIAYRFK
jgi:cytochrome P450